MVGARGNYSDRLCELVDCVSKRLVLSTLSIVSFRGAKRRGIWVLTGRREEPRSLALLGRQIWICFAYVLLVERRLAFRPRLPAAMHP
jgi:hypothetical protein